MTDANDEDTLLPNPEESANFLSKLLFWWVRGILIKGSKAPLQESDVFSCHTDFKSKTLTDKAKHYWDKELKKTSPSLARALFKANIKVLIIIAVQCFFEAVLLLVPTVLVSKISSYFDPASGITRNQALLYGCMLLVDNFFYIGLRNLMFWNLHLLGPTIRIQASTLVYDKVSTVFLFHPLLNLSNQVI